MKRCFDCGRPAEFYPQWNRINRVTASRAGTGRHNYRGKKKTEVLFTNF